MNGIVLGAGPAGLMAAWAMRQQGVDVRVFSIPVKSKIGGAQYLHNRILGITPDDYDLELDFVHLGSAEEYARKAHANPNEDSSWERMPHGVTSGWSIRAAYDRLWTEFAEDIHDIKVAPHLVLGWIKAYDFVVSAIPLPSLCLHPDRHTFRNERHWIYQSEMNLIPDNTVVYNGLPIDQASSDFDLPRNWWHRGSRFENLEFLESTHELLSIPRRVLTTKPRGTDCDCMPQVIRVGRYGRWDPQTLSDSAYWDVREMLLGEAA